MAVSLACNQFWGRRSGTTDPAIPKGCVLPWGNCFKQQQWRGTSNGHSGRPSKVSLINVNKRWFK